MSKRKPPKYCFKVLSGSDGLRTPRRNGRRPRRKWTKVRKNPELCARGWHLFEDFDDLMRMYSQHVGCRYTVYVAEWRGKFVRAAAWDSPKIAVEQARLVQKLDGWYKGSSSVYNQWYLFRRGKCVKTLARKPKRGER